MKHLFLNFISLRLLCFPYTVGGCIGYMDERSWGMWKIKIIYHYAKNLPKTKKCKRAIEVDLIR